VGALLAAWIPKSRSAQNERVRTPATPATTPHPSKASNAERLTRRPAAPLPAIPWPREMRRDRTHSFRPHPWRDGHFRLPAWPSSETIGPAGRGNNAAPEILRSAPHAPPAPARAQSLAPPAPPAAVGR